MKLHFIIFAFLIFALTYCSRQNNIVPDPTNPLDRIDKIDTFITNSNYFDQSNCYIGISWENSYKIFYDSIDRIISIERNVVDRPPRPYCTYSFTYNTNNSSVQIVSKITGSVDQSGDSINIIYNSPSNIDLYKHLTYDNGAFVFRKYHYNFDENQFVIRIKIWEASNNTDPYTQTFECELYKDSNNDIVKAFYFHFLHNKKDTLTTLKNDFFSTIQNPYYSFYKRTRLPLFFIFARGGYSSGNNPFDLSEYYSKHCIKKATGIFYNCYTTMPQYSIEREFPDSLFTISSGKVTRVRTNSPFFMTSTGFINGDVKISYQ